MGTGATGLNAMEPSATGTSAMGESTAGRSTTGASTARASATGASATRMSTTRASVLRTSWQDFVQPITTALSWWSPTVLALGQAAADHHPGGLGGRRPPRQPPSQSLSRQLLYDNTRWSRYNCSMLPCCNLNCSKE